MKLSARGVEMQLESAYLWIIHKVINRKEGKNNDTL